MSQVAFAKPVEDSVPKINEEVAVGEDLEFQRRWWKFERAVWIFFALLIIADIVGVFGRGPLSHATTGNSSLKVEYERIERSGSPSILRVSFNASAIQQDQIRLFVSESVVEKLGAQRIIPAPATSAVGNGGITYTFPATNIPAQVEFALQPDKPGIADFAVQVPGSAPVIARVYTMP